MELDPIPQFKATAKLGEFLETSSPSRSSRRGRCSPAITQEVEKGDGSDPRELLRRSSPSCLLILFFEPPNGIPARAGPTVGPCAPYACEFTGLIRNHAFPFSSVVHPEFPTLFDSPRYLGVQLLGLHFF